MLICVVTFFIFIVYHVKYIVSFFIVLIHHVNGDMPQGLDKPIGAVSTYITASCLRGGRVLFSKYDNWMTVC